MPRSAAAALYAIDDRATWPGVVYAGVVRPAERAVAVTVAGVGLLAFGTPLRDLWAHTGAPWWTPFAVWALGIVAIALTSRRGSP